MMGKRTITGLNVFAFVCVAILLVMGCAKKQVQVAPPPPPDVSATDRTMTGPTDTMPDAEMAEAEEIRQKRLEELQSQETFEGILEQKIHFEYDSSSLSAEARRTLTEIAGTLREYPSWSLDISGHCDERGTIEYNLALGERRAQAAKKFLTDLGISGSRISTVSYGEERPIDPRSTEEAWTKNRRAEFKFIR